MAHKGAAFAQGLPDALNSFSPGLPLAVALSGGADSVALLVACAEKWPGQVHAIHVHHGLQAAADGFERHCVALCAQLNVPLTIQRVDARNATGESPEDAARKARYKAFRAAAQTGGAQAAIKDIAIAQHADDQIETILLALSRGAGLPGLAAMPQRWERDGITYHRPLLAVPGAQLRAWLVERGITWVEDPTNTDEQFTRNRIRARLLPTLEEAFPQFRETFARSARHAAQGQALLLEVAQQDLAAVGSPPVIKALQALSQPRQANVLRHWLLQQQATPSAAQLEQLLSQIAACTTRGHQIHLKVATGHVTRAGAVLQYTAAADKTG
ncbi:tRNA(Ile)-lysidine synthase [Polaromonas sp. YR568]|uniref:tRNA lysidine(34) synthetase TilS n=1 Tax=Polaromonas sp. YR568 TaxID=1855301 RepID=UPI0008E068C2|nr:tRNA lysidine(34) synthetase TilS [Polaromonas sp. YR568]SFU94162.1 tRNA(Ile)-lysidine synthase [Polaromonas sp. YR568]